MSHECKLTMLCLGLASMPVFAQTRGFVHAATPGNAVVVQSRKALLIGNQSYRISPLKNPANDANDLGSSLQKLGFKTTILANVSKSKMEEAVETFAAGLSEGDAALFYYAGHGFQLDSENYLVPVEFMAANEAQAREAAVPFQRVKTKLEQTHATLVAIILDSCRNNPFGSNKLPARGLALSEAGLGSYIAFSASPGKTASDGSERNGLFTQYLLKELEQPVLLSELFRRVRREVYEASGQQQLPYLHDQLIADFSLNPAGAVGGSAAGQAPEVTRPAMPKEPESESAVEGKRLYQVGQCEDAARIFDKLARQQPSNVFVQNALGLALACLKLNVPAVEHFSLAIQLKPDYAAPYLNRGQVFLTSAQYELAIQDFTWAIEQAPENAVFYSRRGRALFGLRRYEDAEADFAKSIALDPADASGYHGRGQVFHQLGRYREALADYDQAIARKRDLAPAYVDRARTRERLGDAAGAASDRQTANRISGKN
jgi:tetratricopeptide (TPR) repeat protein